MYEEISFNFLRHHKLDTGLEAPFFINSEGRAVIYSKTRLDLSDFAKICGIPRASTHIFRKMMSSMIKSYKSIILDQAYEHIVCHSEEVRKSHYVSDVTKKLLMVAGNQWFRSKIESSQPSAGSGNVFATDRQKERYIKAQEDIMSKKLVDIIELEVKQNRNFKPTLDLLVGVDQKINFFLAIEDAHTVYVSREGKTMDILLAASNVSNRKCAKVFLRLLDIMDPDDHSIKVLVKSLVTFCGFHSGQDIPLRTLEWRWAFRYLEVIQNIHRAPHLGSDSLKVLFNRINKNNNYKYICVNNNIKNQLEGWKAKEDEREARVHGVGPVKPVLEYVEEHRATVVAEAEARLKVGQGQSDVEVEQEAIPDGAVQAVLEDSDNEHNVQYLDPLDPVNAAIVNERPAGTPVKAANGRVQRWYDNEKLELLREYLRKAVDPYTRMDKPGGKACYKHELQAMMDRGDGIMLDGDTVKTKLSTLVTPESGADTLAQFMIGAQGKGLSGQRGKPKGEGGLIHIVDEWLEEKLIRPKDIKQHVEEIVVYARNKYSN